MSEVDRLHAAPMTRPVRALLIVNPRARQTAQAELQEGIESLRRAGMVVELLLSEGIEQSRQAITDRRNELDLVIVAGGDGTISSIAQTLMECHLSLAVIPLGTANDLARSLQIPDLLPDVFRIIGEYHRRPVDLGCVNGSYFFNVAHLGLGVQVTRELTDEVKKSWGIFSYLRAFFAAMARIRQFRVSLTVDGKEYRLRSIQLAVGNARFYGGGNVVDETARIDDGVLSLYSLRPQSVWELLTLAPLLRSGRQHHDRRSFNTKGRSLEVNTRPSGMAIHADGEPIARTPARFELVPKALWVVVPESFDQQ